MSTEVNNAASNAAESIVNNESSQADTSKEASGSQDGSEETSEPTTEAEVDADPTLTKKEKIEVKKKLKSLKLKVDGKEYNEDLPFEIDDDAAVIDYMTKQLQMSKMGQKRAKEKADLEHQVDQLINELRKNPRKVLSDPALGIDLKKFAASIIEEEIERSQKSPEQLEKEALQEELRALKEERERENQTNREKELTRLEQIEQERYDTSITKALSNSTLPKSPYVVKKMADYMILGLKNGVELTPEDVLPIVQEEIQNDIQQMFGVMPSDVVEAMIGKDHFKKIRQKNIEKAKSAPVQGAKAITETGKSSAPVQKEVKKQTFKEFFKV
jgi:hypothetical protein